MINWIKYTFGSFFSNKLLKEGQTRKFWNTLFALFLTLVILTAFFVTGVNSSFKTQYNNSTTFKEFAYNIFYNENEENRVNIKTYEAKNANNKNVIKGKAIRYIDVNDEVLINTFENDADKAIYSKNNYNLIVDTREADDTYFSFTVLYKLKDDENVTINYDEYLKLSASDQEKYTYLKTDIKNEKITLTNEQIEIYKDWLLENYVKGLKDDSQEKTSWNELLKKKDEDIKTYNNSIYQLYLTKYYKYVTNFVIPTNSSYYQSKYLTVNSNGDYTTNNFLIITNDWVIASYTSEKNYNISFYGYYDYFSKDYFLYNAQNAKDEVQVKANVDNFFVETATASDGIRGILICIQIFRFMPTIIIAMAILALFLFCISKVKHRRYATTYMYSFKLVSGMLIFASFVAGLVAMILCFVTDTSLSLNIGSWLILSVLGIRTLVFAIIEAFAYKKDPLRDASRSVSSQSSTSSTITDTSNNLNDLSKVETGTKVIVNDGVDDNDEEKMELM